MLCHFLSVHLAAACSPSSAPPYNQQRGGSKKLFLCKPGYTPCVRVLSRALSRYSPLVLPPIRQQIPWPLWLKSKPGRCAGIDSVLSQSRIRELQMLGAGYAGVFILGVNRDGDMVPCSRSVQTVTSLRPRERGCRARREGIKRINSVQTVSVRVVEPPGGR
jgi:hypothetical protein